jgi:hypothetical protein
LGNAHSRRQLAPRDAIQRSKSATAARKFRAEKNGRVIREPREMVSFEE